MNPDRLEKNRYQKQYSEEKFWNKLRTAGVKAGAAIVYPALLLFYVLKSKSVSTNMKIYIIGALGYLILPADLIPDMIPFFGYADDLAAIVAAYKMIRSCVTPEIEAAAKSKAASIFGLVEVAKAAEDFRRDVEEQ